MESLQHSIELCERIELNLNGAESMLFNCNISTEKLLDLKVKVMACILDGNEAIEEYLKELRKQQRKESK